MVADFIDAGVLNQLSGTQRAVRLVKDLRVSLGHFMQAPLRRRPSSLSRQTCRGRSRGVGSAWEENGLRANGFEVKPLLRLRARNWDAKGTGEVGNSRASSRAQIRRRPYNPCRSNAQALRGKTCEPRYDESRYGPAAELPKVSSPGRR